MTKRQFDIIYDTLNTQKFDFPSKPGHLAFVFQGPKLLFMCPNIHYNSKYRYLSQSEFTIHAEANAVRLMKKYDVKPNVKTTMVTIGVKKNEIKNGKPCNHCMDLMRSIGFKKILFSDSNGKFCPLI